MLSIGDESIENDTYKAHDDYASAYLILSNEQAKGKGKLGWCKSSHVTAKRVKGILR